jgi:hypothetical protein
MKKTMTSFVALSVAGLLSGCGATSFISVAPPSETAISATPFTIVVPKDIEGSAANLKGVQLSPFQNRSGQLEFFSVQYEQKQSNELTTSVCRGDAHNTGRKYQSCVHIDSQVSIQEHADSYEIIVNPIKSRSEQGRSAIMLPIALPDVDVNKWYAWTSNQTVAYKGKTTASFSPESIKGNFDRKLKRHSWGNSQADGALRQFKDTYIINLGDGMRAVVGAAFFPYRDGTMIEYYIKGEAGTQNGVTSRDWNKAISLARAEIDKVIKD